MNLGVYQRTMRDVVTQTQLLILASMLPLPLMPLKTWILLLPPDTTTKYEALHDSVDRIIEKLAKVLKNQGKFECNYHS